MLSAESPTGKPGMEMLTIFLRRDETKPVDQINQHVAVAQKDGLLDATIATIVAGQRPADLPHDQAVAYDTAAALGSGGVLPALSYQLAKNAFGVHGVAELVYLVGLYCMVSVTLNGFDVPVPEPAGES